MTGAGWLIGIGSSAGGLEALTQFVENIPAEFKGSIIVAQHLAPHTKSMMVELLARRSSLPVVTAENVVKLEPGHVYVVPPNHDIDLIDGQIHLNVADAATRPKPSVDEFFISLAESYGSKAVGIILSGTGTDGSRGIEAIKNAGGITLAQDDFSAKYDGMPKSAVDTGRVDSILSPEDMAKNLLNLLHEHEERRRRLTVESGSLKGIFTSIRETTGTDFSRYKPSTMQRRIAKRMSELRIGSTAEYVDYLRVTPGEAGVLSQQLIISVTSFFRDLEMMRALEPHLEGLLQKKSPADEFRAWVPGCATGEEAYTIAIMLDALRDRIRKSVGIKVFATDLDQDAVYEARTAVYGERDVLQVPEPYRSRYFQKREDGGFEVIKRIRDVVVFAKQDLIQNPPFVKLDLVSCRNVLIYFETDLQKNVLETFHYALNPTGVLFLGRSESVGSLNTHFEPIDRKAKIFAKLDVPSRLMPASTRAPATSRPFDMSIARRQTQGGSTLGDLAINHLLRSHGLAGVVVDDDSNVIQIVGDVSRYLGFSAGQPDLRLVNLLPKNVGVEVPLLVRKAIRENAVQSSRAHRFEKEHDSGENGFRIVIHPLQLREDARSYLLVSFEPLKIRTEMDASIAHASPMDAHQVAELEQELFTTREHLQAVIEELGVSNEELQALNEELSSTNEELQASNEELETTNEELQSTNEELTTVNEELTVKSGELRSLNTSLENLQNSIGSAIIVLDRLGRVVRFNQEASRIFDIGPGDINRELVRISTRCEIPEFDGLIKRTIESGRPSEAIGERGETVYQVRVQPSLDEEQNIIGAIVLFFDNTELLRTKKRLRKSEEQIRSILTATPSLISLKDTLGRYLIVNEAFCRFFDVKEADLIGRTDREIFPDSIARTLRDGDLEVFLKRAPLRRHETIDYKGKSYTFLKSRFALSDGDDAEPYAVGTIAIDITERVAAQDALEKSELRYRSIVEDQAVFVCRHEPDGTLTFVNSLFASHFGGSQDSYHGRKIQETLEPASQMRFIEQLRLVTPQSPVVQHESPISRPGLRNRWIRWIHRGIFDLQGEVVEFQTVGFDVTEHRLETDVLIHKDAVHNSVFENATDAITVFRISENDEFILESLNRSAERMFGVGSAQALGRNLKELVDPAAADVRLARYRRVVAHGKPESFEEEIRVTSGFKHFSTTLVPVFDRNQRIESVAAISRDISTYKTIESDLRAAKETAEVASRAKSDFLASMSHELRTPLNIVLGMAHLLESSHIDADGRRYANSILRAGRVLLALINDILDISKIEAGKIRLDSVAFNVMDIVNEAAELLGEQAKEKKLELRVDSDPSADSFVFGDPHRLRQVIVNLVNNALKFTEQGSVEIHVKADVTTGGEKIFRFAVVDSGIGIRKEDQDKIFRRFSQIESGSARRYGGTGLGLVISKHIVEMMNGEIGFDSEFGLGTTFWFTIRLPATTVQTERDGSEERSKRRLESNLPPVSLRVLAVDDNNDSRQLIDIFLKRMGHQVALAGSGQEAIALVRKEEFDVVLMDVQMPGLDGYETTARIRGFSDEKAQVPIIALTANAMSGDAEKCIRAGMDGYITKPVSPSDLEAILRQWAAKGSRVRSTLQTAE